jgi:hypothetical protein
MALFTFILQPSADIHLLSGVDWQVELIGYEDTTSHSGNITSQCTYNIANTVIAAVSSSGLMLFLWPIYKPLLVMVSHCGCRRDGAIHFFAIAADTIG